MPAAKVKQYVQATRDQKSLDAPLFKSNDKSRNNGESLVDTIAAEDSDDEEAVEHARYAVSTRSSYQRVCSQQFMSSLSQVCGLLQVCVLQLCAGAASELCQLTPVLQRLC